MAQARKLRREEAAYQIVKRYFLIASYGGERAIARSLGIEPKLVARAMTRLVREGLLAPGTPTSALPRGCYTLTEPHLYG
jgi:hypothetical protein